MTGDCKPMAGRDSRGFLTIEHYPAAALIEKYGSPLYVYSKKEILSAYKRLSGAVGLPLITCVSVKANGNLGVLRVLAEAGAGFDIVSGGELTRVLRAGGDSKKVVFAGVGKTDEEIRAGLAAGILQFNVESSAELLRINMIAASCGCTAPVALRVNPDIDAKTHPYISTGLVEHKFGVPFEEALSLYGSASDLPAIEFTGISCHVGSMISDLSVFDEAFARVRGFLQQARETAPGIRYLDLGGGLAVPYKEGDPPVCPERYGEIIRRHFEDSGMTIVLEPGRFIFANAGILLTTVLYIKENPVKSFAVLDAGFNDLARPILYGAFHDIEPIEPHKDRERVTMDLVGPVCESGDCLARARTVPKLKEREAIAIFSAGAYGFTMASNYNSRPRPAEVLVDGSEAVLVRRRETMEDLLAPEQL